VYIASSIHQHVLYIIIVLRIVYVYIIIHIYVIIYTYTHVGSYVFSIVSSTCVHRNELATMRKIRTKQPSSVLCLFITNWFHFFCTRATPDASTKRREQRLPLVACRSNGCRRPRTVNLTGSSFWHTHGSNVRPYSTRV
jgi:hypothetical protein